MGCVTRLTGFAGNLSAGCGWNYYGQWYRCRRLFSRVLFVLCVLFFPGIQSTQSEGLSSG